MHLADKRSERAGGHGEDATLYCMGLWSINVHWRVLYTGRQNAGSTQSPEDEDEAEDEDDDDDDDDHHCD